jgi:hypothetical protein
VSFSAVDLDERRERGWAAIERISGFTRELRKILSVTLDPTDEEAQRMECLCVAIEDAQRDDSVAGARDMAAYWEAKQIIAKR